jgi:hypothetical protein
VADRGEARLDGIGRSQMQPMLGREVVEGEQALSLRTTARRPASSSKNHIQRMLNSSTTRSVRTEYW